MKTNFSNENNIFLYQEHIYFKKKSFFYSILQMEISLFRLDQLQVQRGGFHSD